MPAEVGFQNSKFYPCGCWRINFKLILFKFPSCSTSLERSSWSFSSSSSSRIYSTRSISKAVRRCIFGMMGCWRFKYFKFSSKTFRSSLELETSSFSTSSRWYSALSILLEAMIYLSLRDRFSFQFWYFLLPLRKDFFVREDRVQNFFAKFFQLFCPIIFFIFFLFILR